MRYTGSLWNFSNSYFLKGSTFCKKIARPFNAGGLQISGRTWNRQDDEEAEENDEEQGL